MAKFIARWNVMGFQTCIQCVIEVSKKKRNNNNSNKCVQEQKSEHQVYNVLNVYAQQTSNQTNKRTKTQQKGTPHRIEQAEITITSIHISTK